MENLDGTDPRLLRSYERGMQALSLLKEWRLVLEAKLPGGMLEGLEQDLESLRAETQGLTDGGDKAVAALTDCVEKAVRRIQSAGLLCFRNQPGVANDFSKLSAD